MKILRIIAGVSLVFSLTFTLFVGVKKIGVGHDFGGAEEYKGILTVWQIDAFEGGIGSRKQFLMKMARSYERKNDGVLVMVSDHTFSSAKESMDNGEYPDLISFGVGIEIKGVNKLQNALSISGGMIGKDVYATAWCRGGYVLITKLGNTFSEKLDSVTVSQTGYTAPLTALATEGFTVEELIVKSPLDAYVDFVNGKTQYLLGTQRDVIRLERRGIEVETRQLCEYNDLYQYIAVLASEQTKIYYSEKFIQHLLTQENQKKLLEIGMSSCFYKVEHENKHLIEMQNTLYKNTLSAFIGRENLIKINELSTLAVKGDKEALIKIKNMFV